MCQDARGQPSNPGGPDTDPRGQCPVAGGPDQGAGGRPGDAHGRAEGQGGPDPRTDRQSQLQSGQPLILRRYDLY